MQPKEGSQLGSGMGSVYGKVLSLLQRGTCRGGFQLSSPFLCCCEQPKNKQSLWIPASPPGKTMPSSSICQAAVGERLVRHVGS